MRESSIEKKVCTWASIQGIQALKLTCQANTGWPDRLFLYQGRSVFIEFKAPGRKLTRNQPARVEWLSNNGFTVRVFDDAFEAIQFLETALLSIGGGETRSFPSLRRPAIPPWRGENGCYVHDFNRALTSKADQGGAGDLPDPPDVQRLAPPKGRV